jgi:hypothetical protein
MPRGQGIPLHQRCGIDLALRETTMESLGVDIAGTDVKGAPVDVDTGGLTTERYRILTPQPATRGWSRRNGLRR